MFAEATAGRLRPNQWHFAAGVFGRCLCRSASLRVLNSKRGAEGRNRFRRRSGHHHRRGTVRFLNIRRVQQSARPKSAQQLLLRPLESTEQPTKRLRRAPEPSRRGAASASLASAPEFPDEPARNPIVERQLADPGLANKPCRHSQVAARAGALARAGLSAAPASQQVTWPGTCQLPACSPTAVLVVAASSTDDRGPGYAVLACRTCWFPAEETFEQPNLRRPGRWPRQVFDAIEDRPFQHPARA